MHITQHTKTQERHTPGQGVFIRLLHVTDTTKLATNEHQLSQRRANKISSSRSLPEYIKVL